MRTEGERGLKTGKNVQTSFINDPLAFALGPVLRTRTLITDIATIRPEEGSFQNYRLLFAGFYYIIVVSSLFSMMFLISHVIGIILFA